MTVPGYRVTDQLELEFKPVVTYGYDTDTDTQPVMSVAQAASKMIAHVVEQHGFAEARRRIPGLRKWGERPAPRP